MWIKYRTKHSHGYGDWMFESCKSKQEADDMLQRIADNHNFSEHWRGIDWSIIKQPPLFILKEKLDEAFHHTGSLEKQIEENKKVIKNLCVLINTKRHNKIKVSCPKCGNHTFCKGVRGRDGSKFYGNSPLKKNSEDCIKAFVLKSKS